MIGFKLTHGHRPHTPVLPGAVAAPCHMMVAVQELEDGAQGEHAFKEIRF